MKNKNAKNQATTTTLEWIFSPKNWKSYVRAIAYNVYSVNKIDDAEDLAMEVAESLVKYQAKYGKDAFDASKATAEGETGIKRFLLLLAKRKIIQNGQKAQKEKVDLYSEEGWGVLQASYKNPTY